MAAKQQAGNCYQCGVELGKTAMKNHLLKAHNEKEDGQLCRLLKIEGAGKNYWLFIDVPVDKALSDVDRFMRDIWLECCGHMSAFRNRQDQKTFGWDYFEAMDLLAKGKVKDHEKLMEDGAGEVPMSRKVKDALYKELVLEYEYDFGSSTKLSMTVIDEYPVKADKRIVLLSRNEPLQIVCATCGKVPATQICTVCMYHDNTVFCDKCAQKHAKNCEDFADYASMPVVNSPRMGVCAYDGGTIDKERDGVCQL